jgi:hypothetical protein
MKLAAIVSALSALVASWIVVTGVSAAVPSPLPTTAPKLGVAPSAGVGTTTFTVRFTAPNASGSTGTAGLSHRYSVTATGPQGASGCVDSLALAPLASRPGQRVAVRLAPGRLGGQWCAGRWSGRVVEMSRPICGPIPAGSARSAMVACPMFIVIRWLGVFDFRVGR